MRLGQIMRAAIAAAAIVPAIALAQSADGETQAALERLDAFVQGAAAAGDFSGVVIVAQDGEPVFERSYGFRDALAEDALTIDTRFDLASAGKMFTATAILQQIAAGRLTLETRLDEILEDYPNAALGRATIYQLLTHSAGAGDSTGLFYPETLMWRGREPSVADLVAIRGDADPTFAPGTEQVYSNHTMILLGRIVEHLSGEDYRSYVAEHICRPAGMDVAHADQRCVTDDPRLAVAYVEVGDERMPNCFAVLDGGWPAGGQAFNARDMVRFADALRNGRLGVPRALFEQAVTPQLNGFGLGYFATDYGGDYLPRDLRWGHGGMLYGQCVDIRSYEATGETIVTLGNNDSPACFRVAGFLHDDWRRRQ